MEEIVDEVDDRQSELPRRSIYFINIRYME